MADTMTGPGHPWSAGATAPAAGAAAEGPPEAGPAGLTDEELVVRARRGDADAFTALVERYERKVYALAYRMSGNAEDATDLAQEAFIRIWRKLGEFRGDAAFSTWVYRITANVCLDQRRHERRRPALSLDAEAETERGPLGRQVADPAAGPDAALEAAELQATIQAEIARLPAEYRAALVLRDLEGHAYQEIADILAVSLGTVKSRISRGRQLLKGRFTALELFRQAGV